MPMEVLPLLTHVQLPRETIGLGIVNLHLHLFLRPHNFLITHLSILKGGADGGRDGDEKTL